MESFPQPRYALTSALEEVEHELLEMGTRVEHMVALAIESLAATDITVARHVFELDDEVDERDVQIENRCFRILALQQPQAGDLRLIGTALKMTSDLERMGDLAVDIARITLKVEKEFGEPDFIDFPKMSGLARSMVRMAMEAFVKRDIAIAKQVVLMDDEVDDLYRQMREQVFKKMRTSGETAVTDGWLLMAIHHVERIADHAVNIVERVAFMITGKLGGKKYLLEEPLETESQD